MAKHQFGVSTHLYHAQRLSRDQLLAIAAHGFETVEVFASPTHIDYHNPAVVADLQQWLAEARLELSSVSARVTESASDEAEQALRMARRIPIKVFVVQLDGTRDTARRSVERLAAIAAPLGVTIAVERLPNEQARPGSLVHFVEQEVDASVGICLDFARASGAGDLVDAIETVSEHVIATHLPLDSAIDWASALTAVQKIGYDGALIFDNATPGAAKDTLQRARKARERLEKLLCTSI